MPLLLLGIRDEFVARSWLPPGRHWPGKPLIGGLDQQAGGTWLAVDPAVPRLACVLNGRGEQAPADIRVSRGELPLGAMADLVRYDPFHLVTADPAAVTVLSWDGRAAERHVLGPGTHVITNAGLDPDNPKVKYFETRFASARPSGDPAAGADPAAGVDPAAGAIEAWQPWLALVGGDGLPPDDPRAIRVARQLPDGRVWGTTSVSYVALAADAIRYDFQPVPGDIYPVAVALPPGDAGRQAELREVALGVEEVGQPGEPVAGPVVHLERPREVAAVGGGPVLGQSLDSVHHALDRYEQ